MLLRAIRFMIKSLTLLTDILLISKVMQFSLRLLCFETNLIFKADQFKKDSFYKL